MEVKKLRSPRLEPIKFSCDKILHEKLLEYPMIADCFSKNNFTVILGRMGAGKSSLMINIVKNIVNKVYENAYVIIPEVSRKSIDNDIFSKELPEDSIYDDLTIETLNHIYNKVKENSKNNENTLIIIDDFQQKFKIKDIALAMETFIIKIRHLHCSVFLLQQNFKKLPLNSRQLITNLIFYDLGKSQLEQIFEEVMPIKKDKFISLINYSFKDKYDWLCLNLRSGKIYKKFDEEIIIE